MNYSNLKKEEIIKGIKNKEFYLHDLSDDLKDDKEIVMVAVKIYGDALAYTSKRLRDDKDVVLESLKKDGWILTYGSKRLRDDKEFLLEAMKENIEVLGYASERLQKDKTLLEFLEKNLENKTESLDLHFKNWYQNRMEFLSNMRNKEDKEFMDEAILSSDIKSKKLKF